MEQETLSRTRAPLYLGRSGCFWEVSQADYRYKKSFPWLFKPLMSAPSNFKRAHVRLQIRAQAEGLQQSGNKVKET